MTTTNSNTSNLSIIKKVIAASMFTNTHIDVIRQLLETSAEGIIGIRIPPWDPNFTVDKFQSYMKPFLSTDLGDEQLDLRGPFSDNFETSINGKSHRNIFYIGRGMAMKNKLRSYLDAKEGTDMEKVEGMFKDILHSYPVYLFRQMHSAIIDETAHSSE